MKLEIAESLSLTWLRHVKACQVVQLNWKPSVTRLTQYPQLEELMETARSYFEPVGLNVFKKTAKLEQWLKQGEIDALGLHIENSQVTGAFAVDIAFHEGGLQYGSADESASRVAKKLLRTAFLLHGPLNLSEGEIIFASPRVRPLPFSKVERAVQSVRDFCEANDLGYTFEFHANESFEEEMLDPVLGLSKEVADTSELFLRGVQLLNLFGKLK